MNEKIAELEKRLVALTRRLEAFTNSKTIIESEMAACILEVNELKYELELERENLEAQAAWDLQNIFERD